MSKDWTCAICGSTMFSKCPAQRNVFEGPKMSIINSVLTMKKVESFSGPTAELFIAYTGDKKHTTGKMLKDMIQMVTEDEHTLINMGCNHRWVLSSETETECSLGCTHNNLTDIPRIKAEQDEPKEYTMQDMLRKFDSAIDNVTEQARRYVNISKDHFDIPVEEDFAYIAHVTGKMLRDIGEGKHLKPAFRVRMPGKDWRDATSYCYFDTKEDAVKYCTGFRLLTPDYHIELDKLNDNQERYETEEWEFNIPCAICGQTNDDELLIRKDGSVVHVSCNRTAISDKRTQKRMRSIKLGNVNQRGEDFAYNEFKRDYELDDMYMFHTGRGVLTMRIFKSCTKHELDEIESDIISRMKPFTIEISKCRKVKASGEKP